MKCFARLIRIQVILALCYLIFPRKAYAYLDPGTGSYILQLIIGLLLGATLAIKIYWRRIKAFFVNIFSKKTKIEKNND